MFGVSIFNLFNGTGETELEKIGIGHDFKYESKEVLKDILSFTGKKEVLYEYYYSEDAEDELIQRISNYEGWHVLSNMEKTDFYFDDNVKKFENGYLYFFNYDFHNEVFDEFDYYHNIELGGSYSQFYTICGIDTDNNVITYFQTERIR